MPTIRKTEKPHPNKPCACGSNIKFKKCCGSAEKWNEAQAKRKKAWEQHVQKRAEQRRLQEKEDAKNPNGPRRRSHIPMMALMVIGMTMCASGHGRRF